MILAGSLEPSIFRAILVSPWPGRTVHVDISVCDDSRVVVWSTHSLVGAILDHGFHDFVLTFAPQVLEIFTQAGSASVLNAFYKDIGIEEHPVVGPHVSRTGVFESLGDDVVSVAGVTFLALFGNVRHTLLDSVRTLISAFDRGLIDLFIELPEIDDRLYHTG